MAQWRYGSAVSGTVLAAPIQQRERAPGQGRVGCWMAAAGFTVCDWHFVTTIRSAMKLYRQPQFASQAGALRLSGSAADPHCAWAQWADNIRHADRLQAAQRCAQLLERTRCSR